MVNEQNTTAKSRKSRDITQFLVLIGVIILLNFLSGFYFFRYDLTEDKRFTMAPATHQLLHNLPKPVHVDVYLEGEFPTGFKRLQAAVRETLEEFRIYGPNFSYSFIDPSAGTDLKKRNKLYTNLALKGIQPTNLFAMEGDKKVEKLVFPGAIVTAGGKEEPVMLLKGNQAATPDERLNQSIEGLEFELASAIRKLANTKRKRIGLVDGHGELSNLEAADFITSLQKYYDVYRVDINKVPSLETLSALIIARPVKPFSEVEKYKLDQFIMQGGKALFFLDAINADLDSIGPQGYFAFPYNLNLDDLLFKYGVRVNADLVQDINSGQIPVVTGQYGNQPQTQLMNWRYFPLLNTFSQHPLTRNLDAVYGKFVSTLDSVRVKGIKKTPLLFTSRYTKILVPPITISLNEARVNIKPALYNKGPQAVGYLLEGNFSSVFTNRPLPEGLPANTLPITTTGKPAKLIVFSDGDFIRNEVNPKNNQPYELGFDRFMRTRFANKDLVMNAVEYLLDESGLINVRSKQITLRPLDRIRIKEERQRWQLLNLVGPLIVLVLFGLGKYYLRRRKYAQV
ncbi:gliding motility-associated ABC transporter substrate-binding protein GldG [Adhaeribacter radiodurans]|uniref:Gliding motility-associated ABC transporter substrate-binding protein GldG n=1 Tax=Adhaeribacter radiodurans TaxID=2745197 RepID=A0A7L7L843_9BACT|nr:gliding motility-associated ABC transporter substrate-binding protein GldG [Adhaeribacter radiodurans]QMU29002.1 gliding motility-associated ABC transporter substrate-binding protein GldG [Adhaeribacter radiodurans]